MDKDRPFTVPFATVGSVTPGLAMKLFISYCHRQGSWVEGALVPCLKAAGATLLIDRERFKAGFGVLGQMDALQDEAERTLLVLSPEYLESDYCRHELERAVARDPEFECGLTVPLVLGECVMHERLKQAEPLWIDLRASKARASEPWNLLFKACGVELGCPAPRWLDTRNELVKLLKRNQSVNLVVPHHPASGTQPRWKGLVEHVKEAHFPGLGCVDLERGTAASRRNLVSLILQVLGKQQLVPDKPNDLELLDRALRSNEMQHRLALLHFDLSVPRHDEYGIDFFAALRNLIEDRCVTLLLQSRRPFMELVPHEHPLSHVQLSTVELDGS